MVLIPRNLSAAETHGIAHFGEYERTIAENCRDNGKRRDAFAATIKELLFEIIREDNNLKMFPTLVKKNYFDERYFTSSMINEFFQRCIKKRKKC